MPRKSNIPSPLERSKVINQMLRIRGSITVADLQNLLGVSDMTVRRCLNEMAREGLLRRVHGGAVALSGGGNYFSFHARLTENHDRKVALAKRAVELIPADSTIYLDGGTTCFVIAKQLALSEKRCCIITDSVAIAMELNDKNGLEALLMGGQLSGDNNTLDGPLTAELAHKFSVDIAFTSASSFSAEQLEVRAMTGVMAKKVILQRAARSVCVADSSKYGLQSCFRFCGWDDIDMLITDSHLDVSAMDDIVRMGVEVCLVEVA